jgi:tetratricopeptide (TPR) repeat protein
MAEAENLDHDNHEGHEHEVESANAGETSEQDQKWQEKLSNNPALTARFKDGEERAAALSDIDEKIAVYDSLMDLAIKENLPPYVAKYSRVKADIMPSPANYMLAGDNYFKAFRLSRNQSKPMLDGAVAAYEKSLEMDPDYLAAKTALGVAYVEGAAILGEMPMKGIGMLRDVLKIDPKNVDAITNLGYFAIQSGQYEKAIERFEQVLQLDPNNAEAYLYLADVYLSQGDNEKGIEHLIKYRDIMNDPLVDQRVNQYIEEIRSN